MYLILFITKFQELECISLTVLSEIYLCLSSNFFQLWTVFWELTMLSPGPMWRMLFHHISVLGPWRGLLQWHWSLPNTTWLNNVWHVFVKYCNLLLMLFICSTNYKPYLLNAPKGIKLSFRSLILILLTTYAFEKLFM